MNHVVIDTPTPDELVPGLILYLRPANFIRRGGICHSTRAREDYYDAPRPFLLVATSGMASEWVGIFPVCEDSRILIREEDKSGHEGWCGRESYAHPEFRWTLSYAAVVSACDADLSRQRLRNYVSENKTIEIEEAIHQAP